MVDGRTISEIWQAVVDQLDGYEVPGLADAMTLKSACNPVQLLDDRTLSSCGDGGFAVLIDATMGSQSTPMTGSTRIQRVWNYQITVQVGRDISLAAPGRIDSDPYLLIEGIVNRLEALFDATTGQNYNVRSGRIPRPTVRDGKWLIIEVTYGIAEFWTR